MLFRKFQMSFTDGNLVVMETDSCVDYFSDKFGLFGFIRSNHII
jgi:hypothetical protein